MAKILDRGCTWDPQEGKWAVWMNCPKGLDIPSRPLYHKLLKEPATVGTYVNRKGVKMVVLTGAYSGPEQGLKDLLLQLRRDLTDYIRKKKSQVEA